MILKSLGQLTEMAIPKGCKKLVVAVAQDEEVLLAVNKAREEGLIIPILVGNRREIEQAAEQCHMNLADAEIIEENNSNAACALAVKLIREGHGDILMKGSVNTGQLVKAILDKQNGLLTGALLSHLAFFESPYYHKILCITDAALNIAPDFAEKVSIVNNAIETCHNIGISCPKIAVLAPVETVNPKMEATIHAAMLTQMQRRNQIEGCIIDGPLALDNAVSSDAAQHKNLVSDVAGDADVLLVPDLNAGNILYKSLSFLGGAACAAVVAGAMVPIVLTSRADKDKSKFLSITLAVSLTQ
jgi:phosphate butyryltransferase